MRKQKRISIFLFVIASLLGGQHLWAEGEDAKAPKKSASILCADAIIAATGGGKKKASKQGAEEAASDTAYDPEGLLVGLDHAQQGGAQQLLWGGDRLNDLFPDPQNDGKYLRFENLLNEKLLESAELVVEFDMVRGIVLHGTDGAKSAFREFFTRHKAEEEKKKSGEKKGFFAGKSKEESAEQLDSLEDYVDPEKAIQLMNTFYDEMLVDTSSAPSMAFRINNADAVLKDSSGKNETLGPDKLAETVRRWSEPQPGLNLISVLLAEDVDAVHPTVSKNAGTRADDIRMPNEKERLELFESLAQQYPEVFKSKDTPALKEFADVFANVLISDIVALIEMRSAAVKAGDEDGYTRKQLAALRDIIFKQQSNDTVEFIVPRYNLNDHHGQEHAVAEFYRVIRMLNSDEPIDAELIPGGIGLFAAVGVGKTYLSECVAGELGVPMVKMGDFRDAFVGNTEKNLRSFRETVENLGRAVIFVDEADVMLGARDSAGGSGAAELEGRVYGFIAQMMSDPRLKGKVLWLVATSRPDRLEVDLKRTGRLDVKIPLYPMYGADEIVPFLKLASKRFAKVNYEINLATVQWNRLKQMRKEDGTSLFPDMMTQGDANILTESVAKIMRNAELDLKDYETLKALNQVPKGMKKPKLISKKDAWIRALQEFHPGVPREKVEEQTAYAVAERTSDTFISFAHREYLQSRNLLQPEEADANAGKSPQELMQEQLLQQRSAAMESEKEEDAPDSHEAPIDDTFIGDGPG